MNAQEIIIKVNHVNKTYKIKQTKKSPVHIWTFNLPNLWTCLV